MKKEMKEEMRTFSEVKVWNHSGSTYGRDAGATEAQLETELETARFEEDLLRSSLRYEIERRSTLPSPFDPLPTTAPIPAMPSSAPWAAS
eukprot:s10782_g1.t1